MKQVKNKNIHEGWLINCYSLFLPCRPCRPATVPVATATSVPTAVATPAACTVAVARSTGMTSTTSAPSSMTPNRASASSVGTILKPAEKPSGCAWCSRGFLGRRLLWLCDHRLCSLSLLAARCGASGADRIRRARDHGLRDCMGDVPVPVRCEVDWIVLSPQPLSGAGAVSIATISEKRPGLKFKYLLSETW
jgi:hypothetical protein